MYVKSRKYKEISNNSRNARFILALVKCMLGLNHIDFNHN